ARAIVVAIGLVLVVAVVVPPRGSKDIWSYTMYGRTVAVHHANPYVRVPADYPADPFVARVDSSWLGRGSVYGPVFVAVAAGGAFVAGDSPLAARLFFQVFAAAALAGILVIIWRRSRSPAMLAWLGLNPLVASSLVNGGHNDLLVGLLLVTAVGLVATTAGAGLARLSWTRAPWTIGFLIGLAVLVKFTAALALLGLVLWLWRQGRRRFAISAAATTGLVVTIGYLPVLVGALRVLGTSNRTVTGGSAWRPVTQLLLGRGFANALPRLTAPGTTATVVFYASAATVVLLAVTLGQRAAGSRRPEPAVATAVASYTVAAEYTYPWYAGWALPLCGLGGLDAVAWVVWVQSIVMLGAAGVGAHAGGVAAHWTRSFFTEVAPFALVVAFVLAVVHESKQHARGSRVSSVVEPQPARFVAPCAMRRPAAPRVSSSTARTGFPAPGVTRSLDPALVGAEDEALVHRVLE
ncbi:MAG: hypothetical protein JWL73_4007, partial [Actinomycetia bacterium]|nr:hypothetical protein [Actinomycetes bacterium]